MERTFDIVAIAKRTILFRGLMIKPNKKVELTFTEKELNSFGQYLEIIECKDTCQKSATIENSQKDITENDKPRENTNTGNKVQVKRKISDINRK